MSINISFYRKDDSFINSKLESLGIYECVRKNYEKFELKDIESIIFYDDLRVLNELAIDRKFQMDIETFLHRYQIIFLDLVNGLSQRINIKGETVDLLFEVKPVLEVLERIQPIFEDIYKLYNTKKAKTPIANDIINEERKSFEELINTLKKTENDNVLVCFMVDC